MNSSGSSSTDEQQWEAAVQSIAHSIIRRIPGDWAFADRKVARQSAGRHRKQLRRIAKGGHRGALHYETKRGLNS